MIKRLKKRKNKDYLPISIIFDGRVFEFWHSVSMFYSSGFYKKSNAFLYIGEKGHFSGITTNPFIKGVSGYTKLC